MYLKYNFFSDISNVHTVYHFDSGLTFLRTEHLNIECTIVSYDYYIIYNVYRRTNNAHVGA